MVQHDLKYMNGAVSASSANYRTESIKIFAYSSLFTFGELKSSVQRGAELIVSFPVPG